MWQKLFIITATVVCVACAGGGQNQRQAQQNPELEPEPVADLSETVSVDEYIEFLDNLKVAVESGDIRDFNRREYKEFQRINRQLRNELAGVETVEQLGEDNQIRVFNLHEELQGVVIGDPENHVICRREHTVGTNFRRTTCVSAGDFERNQEASRRQLRQLMGPGPMPVLDTP
ncbi:hypothetical protein [Wenzhouxiangella sp. EGI_FJ10305]|uniref:hypothetical protein n=1 Tax=Wenzhouxiangella sp. EGI_FJ10305 TaxID=3243768 RepID=UPI0035DDC84F